MTKPIDDEVIALQARIFAGRLKIGDVLRGAGVHRSTWSRWVAGAEPKLGTLRKVAEAVDAKLADQSAS